VFVPSTVKSPTLKCSILPVEPWIVNAVFVVPPSLTVKIISLFCVVFAIIKLSLLKLIVASELAPKINPVSFKILNELFVLSFWSDLK
jgi:hypothetical protein